MIKEYYIIARYVTNVPEGKDESEYIIDCFYEDVFGLGPENMKKFLTTMFTVLPGEVIDTFEGEEE